MNRLVTNKMNYILDNWIPPVIRDSRWFYGIVLRIAVKKYAKYYMEFKEKVPFMSEQEINEYYRILAPSFINRKTDLNRKCIQRILSEINADDSVIDVAAGRGYLAGLVSGRTRNNVVAVDIVKPKSGANEACKYKFVEGTMTDLPFQDKSFDIVLCTHALEHIKDVKKAMSELRRVCRKKIIIVVPCQREYRFTADLHINFYRYEFDVRNCFKNDFEIDLVDGDWYCVANMN